MDEATARRAFEPFFTTKPTGKGTGLGLATVHGIVRQSGGGIRVDTTAGAGTEFRIVLPVATGATTQAQAEAPSAAPRGSGTVLVVQDEVSVRALVTRVLERAGYDVLTAESPAAALRLGASHAGAIDALLTDVILPGVTGPDLARRIAEARPGIRILFMSGYTQREVLQHGIALDSASFIQKPMSPRALAERIGEVLGVRSRSAA